MEITPAELMVWLLAQEVTDSDVVVVGTATPVASLAVTLARETHAPMVGLLCDASVNPDPHDISEPMRSSEALRGRCVGMYSQIEIMEIVSRGVATLQIFRAAQIDRWANLNTTLIGSVDAPQINFSGALGVPDIPNMLDRIVVYEPVHSRRTFVERVDFVTAPGAPSPTWRGENGIHTRGVVTAVTNMCVMRFDPERGWAVSSIHPGFEAADIERETSFEVEVPTDVVTTPPPDSAAIQLVRDVLDPLEVRNMQFPGQRQGVMSQLFP